jgi:hypothetical protein
MFQGPQSDQTETNYSPDTPLVIPGPCLETEEGEAKEREHRRQYEGLTLEFVQRQTTAQENQAKWNGIVGRLTSALVIVSVCGAWVSWLQFRAARDSAIAGTAASQAAIEQIRVSQDAALTARETLIDAQRARAAADLMHIREVARAEKQVAEAAAQSRIELNTTIEQNRLEQRAWVGLGGFGTSPDPGAFPSGSLARGKLIKAAFILNTGKTPARQVTVVYGLYERSGLYVPSHDDGAWMERIIEAKCLGRLDGVLAIVNRPHEPSDLHEFLHDGTLVPPGQKDLGELPERMDLGVLVPNVPFSLNLRGGMLVNGKMTIVVYGRVTYSLAFEDQHTGTKNTLFCAYTQDFNKLPFSACPTHNDMD